MKGATWISAIDTEDLPNDITKGRLKEIINQKSANVKSDLNYSLKRGPEWTSQLSDILEKKLPGSGTGKSYRQAIESWANKGEFKEDVRQRKAAMQPGSAVVTAGSYYFKPDYSKYRLLQEI